MIRRARAVLLLLLAAGAVLDLSSAAPTADTPRVDRTSPSAPSPSAARATGDRALALVAMPPDLGFQVAFRPAQAGSPRARTDVEARSITVFVRTGDAPHRIAHDLAHEYGHAWDVVHLDDADRAAYLRSRGAAGAGWWPQAAGSDYATGAGDFAEVFAACRAASPDFRSRLAPAPADACAALPAAAGAAG